MIKHYYHPMSRAVTTDWMLKELGAEHEQIEIDYMSGENAQPAYRAVNPMGKIPALVDGDVVVTEAAAICAYLADRFPEKQMAPPADSIERGRYYRYLFFPGTTLEPMVQSAKRGPGRADAAVCRLGRPGKMPRNRRGHDPRAGLGDGRSIYRRRRCVWRHPRLCRAVRLAAGRLGESHRLREAHQGAPRVSKQP